MPRGRGASPPPKLPSASRPSRGERRGRWAVPPAPPRFVRPQSSPPPRAAEARLRPVTAESLACAGQGGGQPQSSPALAPTPGVVVAHRVAHRHAPAGARGRSMDMGAAADHAAPVRQGGLLLFAGPSLGVEGRPSGSGSGLGRFLQGLLPAFTCATGFQWTPVGPGLRLGRDRASAIVRLAEPRWDKKLVCLGQPCKG